LSSVFDVEPMQATEVITIDGEVITSSGNKIEDDYDITRKNLRELLTQGQATLTSAIEVAKQSEHPRAFEVVGNLMKQIADINTQLMDLHQQKQKLDAPAKGESKVTNNNAIFVGSTSELNKLIDKMNKGE